METNIVKREGVKISEVFNSIENFRRGVNVMLLQRQYFLSKVLPILKEGQDYHTIKGKKVLSKGGAERICQIFQLTASFEKDGETLASFTNAKDLVAFKCTLRREDGSVAGEGRGCASLSKNGNDENKTIKMASKSSLIDSVIHSSHISAYFTQDLDEMPEFREQVVPTEKEVEPIRPETENLATERQASYLKNLATDRIEDGEELNSFLSTISQMTKWDCSEAIQKFLAMS